MESRTMLRYHVFLALLCAGIVSVAPDTQAQSVCPERILTTHPDRPINIELPEKLNKFDWRKESYPLNSYAIPLTTIESPFFQHGNPAVAPLVASKDMQPEDGWELIRQHFGYDDSGRPDPNEGGNPYMILYNRYTGILRVCVTMGTTWLYDSLALSLELSDISEVRTSLLNDPASSTALDNFSEKVLYSSTAFKNGPGLWYYADFPMSYDPCTCWFHSGLSITIHMIRKNSETDVESYVHGHRLFNNPGAAGNAVRNPQMYPYYNQVLGVLNLLHTPKVRYADYTGAVKYWNATSSEWEQAGTGNPNGRIYRYRLDEEIAYVLNPAAGFEETPDLEAALVFEFDRPPTTILQDLALGSGNPLLVAESDTVLRTRFVPARCLGDLSVELSSPGYLHHTFHAPKVSVRLRAHLRRVDGGAPVLFTATYPAATEKLPSAYNVPISEHPYWASEWLSIPRHRTLVNTVITSDIRAWEDITIGDNVEVGLGTYEIRAGRDIHVSPGSDVVGHPRVRMNIGLPKECRLSPLPPVAREKLYLFCSEAVYRTPEREGYGGRPPVAEDSVEEKQETGDVVLHDAYPNPASAWVQFRFTLGRDEHAVLSLTNPLGEDIALLANADYKAGTHECSFDVGMLPPGIYYYVLKVGTHRKTGSLVVVH